MKTEGVYYIWFYWYTNDPATTGVRCYIMKNNNEITNHGIHAGMSNEGGFLVDLAVDDEIWLKAGNSSYNVTYYAEELHNGFGAFLVGGSTTFTTANPLLANPSTADKGKIVTVNSAGDDLEYGANFRELAYKQTFLTGHQAIIQSDHEKWFDLSSHQSDSDWQTLNTDTTVNVGNGSKVMINIFLYIGSDHPGDHHYYFRLGKKINNTVVWGSSNGISTNNNDQLPHLRQIVLYHQNLKNT